MINRKSIEKAAKKGFDRLTSRYPQHNRMFICLSLTNLLFCKTFVVCQSEKTVNCVFVSRIVNKRFS